MLKNLILVGAALAAVAPASADSWDSNKNIERAMSAAVATYKSAGVSALVDGSESCYAGLDISYRNKNVGRDVEYCISYVLSSAAIDGEVNRLKKSDRNEYFTSGELLIKAVYILQQANIVTRPEEVQRYLVPRMNKIGKEIPGRL